MKVVMLLGNKNSDIKKRVQVVASSGNLSRANGTVTEVIKKNSSYESNLKLARIVVGYGHKSISEHDYLVFAIENVTPIVEQILISYRLTSFTIKSRRNVDFRNVGFYVPIFMDKDSNVLSNNKKLQNKYKKYMKDLFLKYGNLVDKKLPIEEFLKPQKRFKHMFKSGNEWMIEEFQKEVDKRWEALLKLEQTTN